MRAIALYNGRSILALLPVMQGALLRTGCQAR
jgi:hypothetical protein